MNDPGEGPHSSSSAGSEEHERPAPEPLFVRHETAGLAFGRIDQGDGLAIIGAFPLGITLDGVDRTSTQRTFLEAMAVGHAFVAYDQRGSGGSAPLGAGGDWEQLATDLWAVADAAGFERAILYGVFDAGYTAIQAAAMQPDRVLGLILNFTPPSFRHADGVPDELMHAWALSTDPIEAQRFDPVRMLQNVGLDEGDSSALGQEWLASTLPQTVQARAALVEAFDPLPLLRECQAPGLIIEPRRRRLFNGWGAALAEAYPHGKLVQPARGSEALGAIYAYLVLRSIEAGPLASRLSAGLSRTVAASERAVRELDRIVVPVDGSVASGRAVNLACRLGEAQNAELVLLHVVAVPRAFALDDPSAEAVEAGEAALQMGSAIAARHHIRWRTRLAYQREMIEGIVRVATEEGADLIVIANPAAEAEGPIGGIVEELLRRAPCEVLVDRGDHVEVGA
ncbi:MAG: alpha/beta fold hydrolase [Dehalococcoidia bacterium]